MEYHELVRDKKKYTSVSDIRDMLKSIDKDWQEYADPAKVIYKHDQRKSDYVIYTAGIFFEFKCGALVDMWSTD